MHVAFKRKRILLLVCLERALQGPLASALVLAPGICLDARWPSAEDEGKPVGYGSLEGRGSSLQHAGFVPVATKKDTES